jgi:hypothetical protein
MKKGKSGSGIELDRIIETLRQESITDGVVEQVSLRVWTRISQAAEPATPGAQVEGIRGCFDFQRLIPAYVAGNLPQGRKLLLEDHFRECIPCRHALEAARSGGARNSNYRPALPSRRPALKWAIVGMAAALVGLAVIASMEGLLPGLHPFSGGKPAVIENIQGELYNPSSQGMAELASGAAVRDGEEIRTAQGSQAVIRLADSSAVEMSERADVWFSRRWRETTIHLQQGSVIVQAAKQRSGRHLYVATRDCLVSVQGTVFAVTQGIAGSRVSVIRGVVVVDQGQRPHVLGAGDQFSTEPHLAKVPIRDDIAWSRNAGRYLALLGEFAGIQKQLESMPGPPLRYSSRLVKYLPEDTAIYIAIPNLESTLSQAQRLFRQRMQSSEVLQAWWKKQEALGSGEAFDLALGEVRAISQYLGSEIVLAWAGEPGGKNFHPIVLAEVQKPGFRTFLQGQLRSLNGIHDFGLRIVDNPPELSRPQSHIGGFILIRSHVFAISTGKAELQDLAALIDSAEPSRFMKTPFYAAIHRGYHSGAGWLFCADLEQITGNAVHEGRTTQPTSEPTGWGDVQYLMVERKQGNGKTESRATLTFTRQRRGFAAWLGAPSPMGGLSFVSPDSALVASLVLKNPSVVMKDALNFARNSNPSFGRALNEFEEKNRVDLVKDVAGSLGGEVTIAQDGPILPSPVWEAAIEVYHPQRLEAAIEKMIANLHSELGARAPDVRIATEQAGGRTDYTLRITRPAGSTNTGPKSFELNYTFDDGYLLVAPNRAALARAIQNRESGYTLTQSPDFQAGLPQGENAYCSALFYGNLTAKLIPFVQELASSNAIGPGERESIQKLGQSSSPTVVCAYGGRDRIAFAGTGSFLGLGLQTLMRLSRGPGFVPGMSSIKGAHGD